MHVSFLKLQIGVSSSAIACDFSSPPRPNTLQQFNYGAFLVALSCKKIQDECDSARSMQGSYESGGASCLHVMCALKL